MGLKNLKELAEEIRNNHINESIKNQREPITFEDFLHKCQFCQRWETDCNGKLINDGCTFNWE